jgi:hypothetical protein
MALASNVLDLSVWEQTGASRAKSARRIRGPITRVFCSNPQHGRGLIAGPSTDSYSRQEISSCVRKQRRGQGLARTVQTAGACVKECSGFMTYQTGMLSLGNVDMDHGSYIYS